MTYINWSKPFEFEAGGETFHFPTYGNYGGTHYSSGKFGKAPPVDQDGSYLSNRQLDDNKDALDYLFYKHDVASRLADNAAEQKAADLALLRSIDDLSGRQLADPEASLYAGLATIGIAGQVLANNPSPALADRLLPYLEDAVDNIATGLSGLNRKELAKARSVLEETIDTLQDINFPGSAVDTLIGHVAAQVEALM
jgi:hypothetical protein